MAETQVTPWDEINVDETITEAEQAASNDLSITTPVGRFLCTIVECGAVEKNFKNYSCYAANLKMQIDSVIKIEQPILDKGQPIKRNGEIIMKVQDIPADKLQGINALFAGRFIFDDINLFNPIEKEAMKNRRLFVAKRMRLISPTAKEIKTAAWAGAPGRKVIVETEHNVWEDKLTKELKKNVTVGWSGYDYAPDGDDQADTSFNPDEFSDI